MIRAMNAQKSRLIFLNLYFSTQINNFYCKVTESINENEATIVRKYLPYSILAYIS